MYRNRREFLRSCCVLGAAGVASQLDRLGLVTAHAQSEGYKALVCVFFFGGNDSNNMIVPIDGRYAKYQAMRGPVALAPATLLPIGASGYGLHPALTNIQRLYNQQQAAAVFNVGTLVEPTTRARLDDIALPRNLYSHSDQTQQWQSSDPNGGGTGWGGRVNDVINPLNIDGKLPPGITVNGGNALFLSGPLTKGVNFSNVESFGLATFGGDQAMHARVDSLQRLLEFDTGLKLVSAANGVLEESFKSAEAINAALNGAPALPVAFPGSGLGQQLAQVAQIIAARGALGMNRQIFFAGMGGFDNHEDLVDKHQDLMATFDAAVAAFYATLDTWGVTNQVTLFTESEFNRTGNANANVGTDHAWGGHHLVFGGEVHGGQTYGRFPVHELRGQDDAGDRGNWIPEISLDQYAATMGGWFGVSDGDLDRIFPNLKNFPSRRLGFI